MKSKQSCARYRTLLTQRSGAILYRVKLDIVVYTFGDQPHENHVSYKLHFDSPARNPPVTDSTLVLTIGQVSRHQLK